MNQIQQEYTPEKNCIKSPSAILDKELLGNIRPLEACKSAYEDLVSFAKNYKEEKIKQCGIIQQASAPADCKDPKTIEGRACFEEAAAKVQAAADAEKALKNLLLEGEKKMAAHAKLMESVQETYERHRKEMHIAWDETVRKIREYEEQSKKLQPQANVADSAKYSELMEKSNQLRAALEGGNVIENNTIQSVPNAGTGVELSSKAANESTISGYLTNLDDKKGEAAQIVRDANQFKKVASEGISAHEARYETFASQAKTLLARAKGMNSDYGQSGKASSLSVDTNKVPVPEKSPRALVGDGTKKDPALATDISSDRGSSLSNSGENSGKTSSSSMGSGLASLAPLASAGAGAAMGGLGSGSYKNAQLPLSRDGTSVWGKVAGTGLNPSANWDQNPTIPIGMGEAPEKQSNGVGQFGYVTGAGGSAEDSNAASSSQKEGEVINSGRSISATAASLGKKEEPSLEGNKIRGISNGDLGLPTLSISGEETKSTIQELAQGFGLGDLFGSSKEESASNEEATDSENLFGSLAGKKMVALNGSSTLRDFESAGLSKDKEEQAQNLDTISLFQRIHEGLERHFKKGNLIKPKLNQKYL